MNAVLMKANINGCLFGFASFFALIVPLTEKRGSMLKNVVACLIHVQRKISFNGEKREK